MLYLSSRHFLAVFLAEHFSLLIVAIFLGIRRYNDYFNSH